MLQHNTKAPAQSAHALHAAVVALHALCCGAPLALTVLAAGLGASAGLAAAGGVVGAAHSALHGHEVTILALSGVLVAIGAFAEYRLRRTHATRGFPVMFAASVACLFVNAGIVAAHRWDAVSGLI